MRKGLILAGLIMASIIIQPFISIAQTHKTRRISIDLGFFVTTRESVAFGHSPGESFGINPIGILRVNYLLIENLEIGGYFARTAMMHRIPLVQNSEGMYVFVDREGVERISAKSDNCELTGNALFYGIMARYDLLPMLTGKNNLRFKLYANTELGLVSMRWRELKDVHWIEDSPFFEYAAGLNVSYFFTRRFGLNLGYSVGKFYTKERSRWSAGIVFKI